jgi:GNAT superfamily N-acetyltransferase
MDILHSPDLEYMMNANQVAFWTTIWQNASDITESYQAENIVWAASDVYAGHVTNLVLPLRLERPDQDKMVAAAVERAQQYKAGSQWWISPVAIKNGLEETLRLHGYAHTRELPAMAVDLTRLKTEASRLEIKHVEDETSLSDWISVLLEGWPQYPAWRKLFYESLSGYGLSADANLRAFVGYVDGKPVTISSVMFSDGVAGIYTVATHRDFRGRGLAAQITLAPLLEARDEGYRMGILQASSMGHPVYVRMGFKSVFTYQVYQWPVPQP